MSDKPLTDEELVAAAQMAEAYLHEHAKARIALVSTTHNNPQAVDIQLNRGYYACAAFPRLVAEVRRLRAAMNIRSTCPACQRPWSDIGFEHDGFGRATASLWKHADGTRCRMPLPPLEP